MLPVLLLGTGIGVMWAALRQEPQEQQQPQQPLADDGEQPQPQQPQPQQQPQSPDPQQQQQQHPSSRRGSRPKIAALAGLACLAAAAVSILIGRHRRHGRKQQLRGSRRADGRIPLRDLIRFKERQWFVEELENARDADPNSMIRLAKMYLNGQGCQRNIALAQEWVRKGRTMGVPATLDELYATDDPDPHTKLRQLAAMEERRRALRQLGANTNKAGHQHVPSAPPHTAAA